MTDWQYRVVKHTCPVDRFVYFDIREVYYGKSRLVLSSLGNRGKGLSWTKDSKPPVGDTLDELKADLKLMLKAFDLPVLEEKQGKLIEMETKQ